MIRSLIVLCACLHLAAQDVSFDVSPRNIGINEQIRFSIEIKGRDSGRNPTFPSKMDTGDFRLLNPTPSVSTSFSMINGATTSSKTFTYSLRPTKKGKLKFPAQTLVYNGQTYQTPAVDVEVGDENIGISSNRRDPFDFSRRRGSQSRRQGEVFGTVEVPKIEFYQGEAIPLDVYIYISPHLSVMRAYEMPLPDLTDFWVEEAYLEREDPRAVTKNGKRWKRYTAYRKRLFANKTGELTIPQVTFDLSVGRGAGSSLFDMGTRVQRFSEPLTLKIKPLPKSGKPKSFSGLVGKFTAQGELDKSEIKVGETVSVNFELKGKGNLNAIREVDLSGLERDFEVFAGGLPTTREEGGEVVKTWAFALVPKRKGNFDIPMPKISYFDPAEERYKFAGGESYPLVVAAGEGLGSGAVISGNVNTGTLVAEKDINFIMVGDLDPVDATAKPANPNTLLKVAGGFLAADLLLFLILFLRGQWAERLEGNRHTYALKNFRKNLGKLKSLGEDADAYYGGLSDAVLTYFGDKWDREGKGLSLETIQDRFERDGVDASHYTKVAEIIEACDLARFTPSTSESRETLLNKAKTVVEDIEGAMK